MELLDTDSQNCVITNTGGDGDGYCTYNSDNVCYIYCYSGGGVGIGNRYMCYHSLMGGEGGEGSKELFYSCLWKSTEV